MLYWGVWPFTVLVIGAALVMQWEFYGVMQITPSPLEGVLAALAVAGILVAPFLPEALFVSAVALIFCVALIPFEKNRNVEDFFPPLVFGVFYPGCLLVGLIGLRVAGTDGLGTLGFLLTLSVVLFVWATDVGAYYVGKSWGRRKLLPRVSPNKTWEGSVGGLALALLVAVAFAIYGMQGLFWADIIVLAVLCSIFGQIGDLVASSFKRAAGVKDAGNLLPGHGGLMDRLDGLLLAAPVAYLYIKLVTYL